MLGWRIPHRVVLGTLGLLLKPFRSTGEPYADSPKAPKDKPTSPSSSRRSSRMRRGQGKKKKEVEEAATAVVESGNKLLEITEQKVEAEPNQDKDKDKDKDKEAAAPQEYAAALVGGGRGGIGARGDAESTSPPISTGGGALPAKGPLVRFHNVTAIPSRGSTLTKSYRALAELPYGDGQSGPKDDLYLLFPAKPSSSQSWAADYREAGSDAQQQQNQQQQAEEPSARKKARRQLQPVVIKRNIRRQLRLAEEDVAEARKVLRKLTFESDIDLDTSGVLAEVAAAVARAGDLREEAGSIERVRSNLARAGMLGSAVGVPEVLTCPELGSLARGGVLVTTALRGVDVSDAYVMQHAAPRGESERDRFVEGVFAAFGQMCLGDGCFPSNPMPDNLLYMYSGQVREREERGREARIALVLGTR